MRLTTAASLLVVLVLAACDQSDRSVEVFRAVEVRLDAADIEMFDGETRALKATLYDSHGRSITNPRQHYSFEWRVSDPSVLRLEANGEQAVIGYVRPGSTEVLVIASRSAQSEPSSATLMSVQDPSEKGLEARTKVNANQKPAGVKLVQGNGQKGRVLTVLPDSLVVQVVDRQGVGVAGQLVDFVVASGGGTLEPASAVTDSAGYALTAWLLGPEGGEQTVEAAVPNVGGTTFVAEALPGDPAQMVAVSGSGQTAAPGGSLASPLVAAVLDEFGNAVPGVAVKWTVQSGGGTVTPLSESTDSMGRASATWTLGAEGGEQRAQAAAGTLSVQFSATGDEVTSRGYTVAVEPASVTLDAINATAQLKATVKDAAGTTVDTARVTWSSTRTAIATVDDTGKLTAKSVGTALIIATAAGVSDTAHVTVRQVAASVEVSPSSVTIEVGATSQLTAQVLDAGGTAIPGATLSWASSAPSVASVSNGLVSGVAAGSVTVSATSGSASGSAAVTVEPASAPTEPPPSTSGGVWLSASEIAALPTSGSAWSNLKSAADASCGTPDLSNQDDPANVCIMAKALVHARTGGSSYRDGVVAAIRSIVNSGTYSGRALALGRELGAYVVAADLINLAAVDPTLDADFRARLRELRTTRTTDGPKDLVECHDVRPNNWGLHCGASLAAVAAYLDDRAALDHIATVFRGWLGERSAYASFKYGSDLSWQADPNRPVGINPRGATKEGHSIDGVMPEEMRRCGSFQWPPCETGYNWEALQGAVGLAWLLHQQGYAAFAWGDSALLRSVQWLHTHAGTPADGDDTWIPHIINRVYGSSFPAPVPSRPGKNLGWADWTHGR
jgi:hypothetical protein